LADLKKNVDGQKDESAKLRQDLVAAQAFESQVEETKKEAESIKQQLERALMHKTKSQETVRSLEGQLEKMMPIEEHEALVNQELRAKDQQIRQLKVDGEKAEERQQQCVDDMRQRLEAAIADEQSVKSRLINTNLQKREHEKLREELARQEDKLIEAERKVTEQLKETLRNEQDANQAKSELVRVRE
jgi:hypothetical protein